jgi:hypothetical protein
MWAVTMPFNNSHSKKSRRYTYSLDDLQANPLCIKKFSAETIIRAYNHTLF